MEGKGIGEDRYGRGGCSQTRHLEMEGTLESSSSDS